MTSNSILKRVRDAARKRILFLPHTIRQISRPERMIPTGEIKDAVMNGEVIEDYPEDARGHSCLLLGSGNERFIHVVCAPKDDYLAIITAYLPAPDQWTDDLKQRL